MAFSSSPAPPKKPRPYEVFLSFRGEDVRNKFVSHLHSALKGRGIRTYFDETNLERGQTIAIELVKAIEESSIAIVVLSRNYGTSTWCLNELEKIMECKNKFGLVVFPIFYDVSPSDVRWQENSFLEAFSIHEVNFKDNGEMVENWRKALKQLADLAGEDIRGKNETSSIKKIADKILIELPVKASQFRKSLVGIESHLSEIKQLISSKPNEVLFIGIWGMGGIGKTTIARALFEDCKHNFEGSCFLNDVKENKNMLQKLQKNLLYDILKTKFVHISDVVKGSSIIKERLQYKKVLLVLDDVDHKEQLNALANLDWFGRDSIVIITTRDKHLIDEVHIEEYNVETLPENEALQLFCRYAFKNDHPPEDFENISDRVLRYVGGLPLAIRVLGSLLYGREKDVWKSILSRLKNVPEGEIISKLQVSFEGLNVLQKTIFLDIACFFRGESTGSVVKRLESLGLHPEEGLNVLIEKSLIYISDDDVSDRENGSENDDDDDDDDDDECIEMHYLIQEMGWYIVRERSNWDVSKYSHLWVKRDVLEVLSSDITVSSEAERIMYDVDDNDDEDDDKYDNHEDDDDGEDTDDEDDDDEEGQNQRGHVSRTNFKKIYRMGRNLKSTLKIGEVKDKLKTNIRSFFKFPKTTDSRIPGSPSSSVPNDNNEDENGNHGVIYSKLGWEGAFTNMNKLSFLELRGDLFKGNYHVNVSQCFGQHGNKLKWFCWNDYPGKSLPKSFHPINLVHLQMEFSSIEETPDISHMPNLEVLNLSESKKLVHVHPSIGDHLKIKHIDLSGCQELAEFPKINRMKSLEILDLSITNLQSFPEIYGNLDSLRKLNLRGTSIKFLPEQMVGNATRLQNLELVRSMPFMAEITSLDVITESFQGLVTLKIKGIGIVQTMNFSLLPYLEKLDLSNSEELVEVHASVGVHKKIKSIKLKDCSKLKKFPKIVDMDSLEIMNLSGTRLQSFPEIGGNVENLVELNLEKTDITTLPWSIGRATGLEFISMKDCKYLLTLPISILGHRLRRIFISNAGGLKHFTENMDDEVELHSLGRKIREQFDGVCIYFRSCESLEELTEPLLSRVEGLDINECSTLTKWICFNLVELLGKYQHLCYLLLHQENGMAPHKFLQGFSKWDSISNMLQKREKYFRVCVPGRQIPSWSHYKISRRSVTIFLPPSSEWYTDKFRGFVVSGINIDFSTPDYSTHHDFFDCPCPEYSHVVVMYIPIDNIKGGKKDWENQNECTLLALKSHLDETIEMEETFPRWGLSLVYSEGEVNEIDPHQVIIVPDDNSDHFTFKVKIAQSREMLEKLSSSNNSISLDLFKKQSHSQEYLIKGGKFLINKGKKIIEKYK